MNTKVIFSKRPWVDGMRALYWVGPIEFKRIPSGENFEQMVDGVLEEAAQMAIDLGCNAVFGVEIDCDPYEGGHISFKGTGLVVENFPREVHP